jgi:hypothetical protein
VKSSGQERSVTRQLLFTSHDVVIVVSWMHCCHFSHLEPLVPFFDTVWGKLSKVVMRLEIRCWFPMRDLINCLLFRCWLP